MYNKSEINEWLHNQILRVTFEKANGEKRVMVCTLVKDYLPEQVIDPTKEKKERINNVLSVWDLEKQGWRSFSVDKVTLVEEVNETSNRDLR